MEPGVLPSAPASGPPPDQSRAPQRGQAPPGQPPPGWPPGTPAPRAQQPALSTAQSAAPAPRPRQHYLAVRAGMDRNLAIGALAGGVLLDTAWRAGLATIAAAAWVTAVAVVLLLSGRLRGPAGRLAAGTAAATSLLLAFRSSPWVLVPVTIAAATALLLGASLGADRGGASATFPALILRLVLTAGHLVLAPGMLRQHGAGSESAASRAARRRAAAIGRGVLLGAPAMIIVWGLLAAADPIFRSWFEAPALVSHLVLLLAGSWTVAGLARAASARQPVPALPKAPALGTVEACSILGGLCVLYAVFVAAQLSALSGAGQRILVTSGMTYAGYARSGFFELLICAAITLVLLFAVRACAAPHSVLTASCALTAILTIGVVITAIRRLQLYEAAYGLTMLRLACLVVAAWIGVVFILTALTITRRGLPQRLLPAAVLVSALVFTIGWAVASPAAIVARVNLSRAAHGRPLDTYQVARLGPDATPALLAGLHGLPPAPAAQLRSVICAAQPAPATGAAFNMSVARARAAAHAACGPRP
jgi:two-component system, OmpR family, sensor histidine kinase BaeS